MRVRAVGEQALLLEYDDVAEVRAAHAEAVRRRDAGRLVCTDLVPAARTLLLDGLEDLEQVRGSLGQWSLDPVADDDGPLVLLPVTWDGPDLGPVADLAGLTVDDVVGRLRSCELVVAFCGFAPGFAYLTGAPAELHVARLEEPRSRVPAGSVGLAGPFTGVYPRASPGGWRLVGRTSERLWDLDREPAALLVPGTRVRFVDA